MQPLGTAWVCRRFEVNSLPANIGKLKKNLENCELCPRACHVNRQAGQIGTCQTTNLPVVASFAPHFGEEPVLVGTGGSGTIFFSGCNLKCVFCQNYDISHKLTGKTLNPLEIADVALQLQQLGCENINFVTPTHVAHAVAEAIYHARRQGLSLPVVYNCGGYESLQTLELLEGLIDIYMPDFKYADSRAASQYSQAEDYPTVAADAVKEMYRQVGPLQLDKGGLAFHGLLVRHLVLPHNLVQSQKVIETIAEIAPHSAVNIMDQYHPEYKALAYPELCTRPCLGDVNSLRHLAQKRDLVLVDH